MKNDSVEVAFNSSKQSASNGDPFVWAVFRDGKRVSDRNYEAKDFASNEYKYWVSLVRKWDRGSSISIREIDPSKGKY